MDGTGGGAPLGAVVGSTGLALAAAISVLLMVLAVDHARIRKRVSSRLERFGLLTTAEQAAVVGPRSENDLVRRLGAWQARRVTRERLQALHGALVQSGVADRVNAEEFLGLRLLASLAGAVAGAVLGVLGWLALGEVGGLLGVGAVLPSAVLGGAVGYVIPTLVLARLARRRRAMIERLLPSVVDVLVVSMEAGLGFDTIVAFQCERADTPLTVELRRYLADLRLGRSRREALLALVERTQSPGLRELAGAVIQADELGTGLARALRAQAVALRAAQRVRAEELARQAPIKLIFPIVLCIMPVLFIVIIGPALLQALAVFGG